MFHQVFICNSTKDPDSKDSLLALEPNYHENNSVNVKQESNDFDCKEMGPIQKEDLKIAIDELKSEKLTIANSDIYFKPELPANLITNSFFNTTSTLDVTSSPVILPPPQQPTVVFQPLAGPSSYIYQPPEQVVNINGSMIQLPMSQATPIYTSVKAEYYPSDGTTEQNMAMTEKSPSSQNKIDSEHDDANKEEDKTLILSNTTQFEELNSIGNSVEIRRCSVLKEGVTFSNNLTKPKSENQMIKNEPEKNVITKTENKMSDEDFRMVFKIKERFVDIDPLPSSNLLLKTDFNTDVQVKNEDISVRERDDCTKVDDNNSSGRDDNTDVGDSSGSDWEKEVLTGWNKRKNSMMFKKQLKNNNVTDLNPAECTKNKKTIPLKKNLKCRVNTLAEKSIMSNTKLSNKSFSKKSNLSSMSSKNLTDNLTLSSSLTTSTNAQNNWNMPTTSAILYNNVIYTLPVLNVSQPPVLSLIPPPALGTNYILTNHHMSENGVKTPFPTMPLANTKSEQIKPDKYNFQLKLPLMPVKRTVQEKILPKPKTEQYCRKCDKHFESVDSYHRHSRYSLCGGHRREARFQCDLCGKCLSGLVKLEAHKNSHTNARPFKCVDCDKHFNSKVARHMHHKKMHLNVKKNNFLCCFCGYMTQSGEHLLAHEDGHRVPEGTEVAKPFKCLVCGKGFVSRFKHTKHQREHKLKKCGKCSEAFATQIQLMKHKEEAHNIIKTYQCEVCGMKFRHSHSFRSHKKTVHSTVLPFVCAICDKGFKRKCNLQQHMITHSEERPISCPECGDSFKRITHLKQHTAAIHRDGRK